MPLRARVRGLFPNAIVLVVMVSADKSSLGVSLNLLLLLLFLLYCSAHVRRRPGLGPRASSKNDQSDTCAQPYASECEKRPEVFRMYLSSKSFIVGPTRFGFTMVLFSGSAIKNLANSSATKVSIIIFKPLLEGKTFVFVRSFSDTIRKNWVNQC